MQKRFDDQQHDIFIWIFLLTRGSFFKEETCLLQRGPFAVYQTLHVGTPHLYREFGRL